MNSEDVALGNSAERDLRMSKVSTATRQGTNNGAWSLCEEPRPGKVGMGWRENPGHPTALLQTMRATENPIGGAPPRASCPSKVRNPEALGWFQRQHSEQRIKAARRSRPTSPSC
jgi:hypothetical protein